MEIPCGPSKGAGRLPWKPGLHGPWEVVDVRGHRLWLAPVVSPLPAGGPSSAVRRFEAHAEECVLIPADPEPESREPVVFEEDAAEDAPSLGQQVSRLSSLSSDADGTLFSGSVIGSRIGEHRPGRSAILVG